MFKKAGLEDFQLTIGNVEFFESLIQAGGFEEKIEEQVRDLIKNRNFFGIDEVFDHIEVSQNAKDAFAMLPSLIGTVEILEEAKKLRRMQRQQEESGGWNAFIKY